MNTEDKDGDMIKTTDSVEDTEVIFNINENEDDQIKQDQKSQNEESILGDK